MDTSISLKSVLQLVALDFTVIATLFLYTTSVGLSAIDIKTLATPKWGYHPDVAKNLIQQKVTGRIGAVFMLLALAASSFSLLFTRWSDLKTPSFMDWAVGFYALIYSLEIGGIYYNLAFKRESEKIQALREEDRQNHSSSEE